MLLITRTFLLMILPVALAQAQNSRQQKLERTLQAMFCNCFSDSLNVEDFRASVEREMECRSRFLQEHEITFDSIVIQESARLGSLTTFEKDHFIDDEMMTNSVLYIMKNCDQYNKSMSNIKVLYFQVLEKKMVEGKVKDKNEFLTIAVAAEKKKKYSRQAGESYGNVAMLYELEGNTAAADKYYKKSLIAYPTPMMMAFYRLLQMKVK